MRARYVQVGIAIAVIIASGLFVVFVWHLPPPDAPLPPTDTTPVGGGRFGVAVAPEVTDIPHVSPDLAFKVAEAGADSLSAMERATWDTYLAATAAVVSENAGEFYSALDAAVAAIVAGDTAFLSARFAPDESVSDTFVQTLVGTFPQIDPMARRETVDVFAVGGATVYFGYAIVNSENAGPVARHTIAVPMRFIDGSWYLTSIGSSTAGIMPVQTVVHRAPIAK